MLSRCICVGLEGMRRQTPFNLMTKGPPMVASLLASYLGPRGRKTRAPALELQHVALLLLWEIEVEVVRCVGLRVELSWTVSVLCGFGFGLVGLRSWERFELRTTPSNLWGGGGAAQGAYGCPRTPPITLALLLNNY